jgi:hypothetical protein
MQIERPTFDPTSLQQSEDLFAESRVEFTRRSVGSEMIDRQQLSIGEVADGRLSSLRTPGEKKTEETYANQLAPGSAIGHASSSCSLDVLPGRRVDDARGLLR